MQLVTLGSLAWPGVSLTRPKPLLLAYLALEEPQSRRDLAHLFWPKSADPAVNLRTGATTDAGDVLAGACLNDLLSGWGA